MKIVGWSYISQQEFIKRLIANGCLTDAYELADFLDDYLFETPDIDEDVVFKIDIDV